MRKTNAIAASVTAILALAGQMWAGGFILQLGNPEANAEAQKMNAVVVIKAAGCHDPATAKVTAMAISMVDGQRREIPLRVDALSEPGTFAVTQQWPKEGKWVIVFAGKNSEQFTNTLAIAGPKGVDRYGAKYDMKKFTESDIEGMLK